MFENGSTIDVGDAQLFVAQAGNPQGIPLVLLHGGLGCRNDFLPLANMLADKYRLIAIDTRGHGRSTLGTRPMTYHQLEQDIATVLETLALTKAAIIGHSDGAIVALRLAAAGLVQAQGIVAVGAHWDLPLGDPIRSIYNTITVEKWQARFSEQITCYEAENPASDFKKLFDATKAMWLGADDLAYPGKAVGNITVPLLVVHGDDDFLVPRHQAFALAEQVKDARLLNLPFASHTVMEDEPALVAPAINAFIASLTK